MKLDNVEVLGFKGKVTSVGDTLSQINDIKKDGEIIQLLNADAVAGKDHIVHGVNQALLSFERGENLANDLSVEIVLRCSAQRQISKAFNILGLVEGEMNLCCVLVNCGDYKSQLSELFCYDESVLAPDDDYLKKVYGIGECEMPVEDIIIDRISKLAVDY